MSLLIQKISFQKAFLPFVDSSNAELIRRLDKEHLVEGTLLQTAFQTGGKGQGGTVWESEKDKNLLFSFVIKPRSLKISEQFNITIIVSLALADVVRSYFLDDKVKIKWPNDIYFENKKLAGVLIENAIQGDDFEWVVIGVGLNVNQQVFESEAPNPISLSELLEKEVELDELIALFESQFAKRYAQLQSGDYYDLKYDYLCALYQYNEWKNYRSDDKEFKAKIVGVDQYGFLRMETPDGERSFDIKEVEYL